MKLIMGSLDGLPAALPIITRECSHIWQELLWQSISVGEKCLWRRQIYSLAMRGLLILLRNTAIVPQRRLTELFRHFTGLPPSSVKNKDVSLKSFSPIVFRIAVKGAAEINYRIETKSAFRIVGVSAPIDKKIEKSFMEVPKMWQASSANGTIQKLAEMMDAPPMGVLGVSICNNDEQWKYFIAVSSTKASDKFEEYTVPASTWAVFSGEGTNLSIQELELRIMTEWLPTSGYEYADAPDIEVYFNPDPQNTKYEVWIPIAKKR